MKIASRATPEGLDVARGPRFEHHCVSVTFRLPT